MRVRSCLPAFLFLAACGGDASSPERAALELPGEVEIGEPTRLQRDLEVVETWSEQVANDLLEFSDKLRRRDFNAARQWVTDDFAGEAWDGLGAPTEEALPLESTRTQFDVAAARVVGAEDFLAGIASHIAPWQRTESVLFKVKAADFEAGRERWGKLRIKASLQGVGEDGGPRSITAWLAARVDWNGEQWSLSRTRFESLTVLRRARALFANVSTSGGVAHSGVRFGQPGNRSYAWNGAASADVDGDGLFDIYLPGRPHGFLYRAQAAGGFV